MTEERFFTYGDKEINHLKEKDPILGAVIDEIGLIKRPVTPDLFASLIKSIVGQQISTKAQATVWKRINDRFGGVTPENLDAATPDELQACGLSFRKTGYIKNIVESVITGTLDLNGLEELSDDDVCKELCKMNGVGPWTAEMLMTFSMERQNIISYGDLAIRRGLRMVYGHMEITKEMVGKYKKRYTPYATVASLYLWAVAGGALERLTDPAPIKKPKKNKSNDEK